MSWYGYRETISIRSLFRNPFVIMAEWRILEFVSTVGDLFRVFPLFFSRGLEGWVVAICVSLSDLTSLHGQITCVFLIHSEVYWKTTRYSARLLTPVGFFLDDNLSNIPRCFRILCDRVSVLVRVAVKRGSSLRTAVLYSARKLRREPVSFDSAGLVSPASAASGHAGSWHCWNLRQWTGR